MNTKSSVINTLLGFGVLYVAGLVFASQAVAQADARQTSLLVNNCLQCHAHPETGAPLIGASDDWQAAVAEGEDAMLVNVVKGIRGMPPLGYCSACDEQDLRVLIRVLTGTTGNSGEKP